MENFNKLRPSKAFCCLQSFSSEQSTMSVFRSPFSTTSYNQRAQRLQYRSQRKLEALRKQKEAEEQANMRSKPRILQKSRVLARRAQRRMFEEEQSCKEIIPEKIESPEPFFADPEQKELQQFEAPDISLISYTPSVDSRNQTPTKSFYYMSMLERSQFWTKRKEEKLKEKVKEKAKEEMKECFFAPKVSGKVPISYQKCSSTELKNIQNSSFITTCTQMDQIPSQYTQLSPYPIKVSFNTGCNISQFLTRTQNNLF